MDGSRRTRGDARDARAAWARGSVRLRDVLDLAPLRLVPPRRRAGKAWAHLFRAGCCRRRKTMIDHVSIAVSDLGRAVQFYQAVLGTIGYAAIDVRGSTVGFGKKYSEFWLNARPEMAPIPPRSALAGAPMASRACGRMTGRAATTRPSSLIPTAIASKP